MDSAAHSAKSTIPDNIGIVLWFSVDYTISLKLYNADRQEKVLLFLTMYS